MTENARISETQEMIGDWCAATFPGATPERFAEHIREEVSELRESIDAVSREHTPPMLVAEELADLAILIFSLADHLNISLAESINWKHAINRRRSFAFDPVRGYDKRTRSESKTYDPAFNARARCTGGNAMHTWGESTIANDWPSWIAGMVYQTCVQCGSCRFLHDSCHETGHAFGLMQHDAQREMYFRVCHVCNGVLWLDAEDVSEKDKRESEREYLVPREAYEALLRDAPNRDVLRYTDTYDSKTGERLDITENAPRTQEIALLSDESSQCGDQAIRDEPTLIGRIFASLAVLAVKEMERAAVDLERLARDAERSSAVSRDTARAKDEEGV